MFGQRTLPGCFLAICLLKDFVRNDEMALIAELQLEATIIITVIYTMPIKGTFSGHRVHPNSSIEVVTYQ